MLTMSYDTKQFLLHYWRDLATPLSLKLVDLLEFGLYDEIAKLVSQVSNSSIRDPYRLRRARMAVDIIKKADYLPLSNDTQYEALSKWCAAEKQCAITNSYIGRLDWDATDYSIDPTSRLGIVWKYLPKIRKEVRRIIGEVPDDIGDFFGGFGPGATLSNTKRESSVLHKLSATPTITSDAVWFTPALPKRLRNVWGDVSQWSIEEAGRLQFVPKNFKTDRPIMVEPLVNAAIQRAIGLHFKRRLFNMTGIDLSTAPQNHAKMACQGSIDGTWATIDLSSASDTIARKLVEALVDDNWWRILDGARTKRIDISDVWVEYPEILKQYGITENLHVLQKFSSMGNGFTFELETIIFYAIAKVVARESGCRVGGVFGDDIIVGHRSATRLIIVLEAFGFTVNWEKSYITGPFRESCGGDYHSGVDVKGVTLKTEPKSVWDWYDLHNRIWESSLHSDLNVFQNTLRWIRKRVPRQWRNDVPFELGGGGFYSHRPRSKTINGIHYYRCLIPTTRYMRGWEEVFSPEVQLAAGLLGGVASNSKGRLMGPPLLDVKSCKLAWVPLS